VREKLTQLDVRNLRLRETKTIESWFLDYADIIYTFIFYRVGKDPEIAADVVQETFLSALDKIEQYELERGTMFAWLTYISKNYIKKALRERKKYKMYSELWDKIDTKLLAFYTQLATTPLPEEVLQRQETIELVHMTLSNIPGNYRQVLKQHYFCKQSLQEIAMINQVSEAAVKSLLYRARIAFKTTFLNLAVVSQKNYRG
jgi:RNA polymerase sigma-70 factor, ECF subfamily